MHALFDFMCRFYKVDLSKIYFFYVIQSFKIKKEIYLKTYTSEVKIKLPPPTLSESGALCFETVGLLANELFSKSTIQCSFINRHLLNRMRVTQRNKLTLLSSNFLKKYNKRI